MRRFKYIFAVALLCICAAGSPANHALAQSRTPVLAAHPPMGWNSWDAYGLTITEEQFRANVDVMAKTLKPFGWEYAVIDEGWFLKNPLERPTRATLAYS